MLVRERVAVSGRKWEAVHEGATQCRCPRRELYVLVRRSYSVATENGLRCLDVAAVVVVQRSIIQGLASRQR